MGRKRRRERREAYESRAAGADRPKSPDKTVERLRAKYADDRRRLERRRTIVGLLALIPLAAWALQLPFGPLDFLGVPARDGWLLVWTALFGSFLGITIRLILERRRFARGAVNERPA